MRFGFGLVAAHTSRALRPLVALLFVVACGAQTQPTQEISGGPPPPTALDRVAKSFGLSVRADWTWVQSDPQRSRFDWVGHPKSGKYDVLYSFWIPKLDATQTRLLPGYVETAAANLTNNRAQRAFDQSPEIAQLLGVDRVITVCFEPAPFMQDGHLWDDPPGTTFTHGVAHGIVRNGSLTIVVVLANDATGVVPLADLIGLRQP
jgi:hypothetical protein